MRAGLVNLAVLRNEVKYEALQGLPQLQRTLFARRYVSRARATNRYRRASWISGSSPTVAENRTFRWLPVRTLDEEVHGSYAASHIAQHLMQCSYFCGAKSDLMVTNTAPEGDYAPTYSVVQFD